MFRFLTVLLVVVLVGELEAQSAPKGQFISQGQRFVSRTLAIDETGSTVTLADIVGETWAKEVIIIHSGGDFDVGVALTPSMQHSPTYEMVTLNPTGTSPGLHGVSSTGPTTSVFARVICGGGGCTGNASLTFLFQY